MSKAVTPEERERGCDGGKQVEGAVNHHASTHKPYIDVQDEYSGGSVPLMALEATSLHEMGGCDGKQLTQEEASFCKRSDQNGVSFTRGGRHRPGCATGRFPLS